MDTLSSTKEARIYNGLKNDEDVITYNPEVFDNGQVTIDVLAREREMISYSGEMILK